MKYHSKKKEQYFDGVIRLYYEKKLSFNQISKLFPLSATTISNWICTFASEKGQNEEKTMKKKTSKRTPESSSLSDENRELRRKLAEMEKKLKNEKLRADFYEEMVNVAEDKFKISIRKKAGAKQ